MLKAFVSSLVIFASVTAVADVSPIIGVPTTKEKITCVSISEIRLENSDAMPTVVRAYTEAQREFWSVDDVTWYKTTGTVTVKSPGQPDLRSSYQAHRETYLEKISESLEVERSVVRYQAQGLPERQWITADHFEIKNGERRLIRSFVDGEEVSQDIILSSTDHVFADGRRVTTTVQKPYLYEDNGLMYDYLRGESTCLTEGL